MSERTFIIRYNEIGLKGGNRRMFEDQLVEQIRLSLNKQATFKINKIRSRILLRVISGETHSIENKLAKIPGIHNYSLAEVLPVDMEVWEKKMVELFNQLWDGTKEVSFKVSTQRSDKGFALKSPEVNMQLGSAVALAADSELVKVKLKQPDIDLGLEIHKDQALIFTGSKPGPGGLPVGSAGKLLGLLSGGIDSPVAMHKMIRRGCKIDGVFFENRVFLGRAAHSKVKRLMNKLREVQNTGKLFVVPFADIQVAIRDNCNERYRVLLYRRLMLRIAEMIAKNEKALALVTGENLGQVASQTLENMDAVECVIDTALYRPLIADDKLDIMNYAKAIDTYEISIEDAPDCCTVFMPKKPATKASREQLDAEEAKLDIEGLCQSAIEAMEVSRD